MNTLFNPKGEHRLSGVNPSDRTGMCAVCGPVKLRWRAGRKQWCCGKAEYQWRLKGRLETRKRKRKEHALRGLCEICKKQCKLHRDHDHATGLSRGFLCLNCNTGLGQFKDKPELLVAAIEYLKTKIASRAKE
jgi:hypothetical protein